MTQGTIVTDHTKKIMHLTLNNPEIIKLKSSYHHLFTGTLLHSLSARGARVVIATIIDKFFNARKRWDPSFIIT